MAYLENLRTFGIIAIMMGSMTLLFNVLSFHEVPFFMISKSIPAAMLIIIGITAYRMKTNDKVHIVVRYLIFAGMGLFISGVMLYAFWQDIAHDLGVAWEYLLVAPLGLALSLLGIVIARNGSIKDWQWPLLQILMGSLALFSVFELVVTLMDGDLTQTDSIIKIVRDIFQIGNALLLYLALSAEIKGRTRIHAILDLIPSRK